MPEDVPAVAYLQLGESPHLVASECADCGALYLDRRNACARCGRTSFQPRQLADDGIVRAFTVVHRAAPGLEAPYTSAVVELSGGGFVKANLVGVTDPDAITPGLEVRLVTFPAGQDDEGRTAVAFGYEPVGGAA